MESALWNLIRDEAEAVQGYYDVLEKVEDNPEMIAVRDTLRMIISDERDHLDALNYLYSTISKNKPATDALDFAKQCVKEQVDLKKLLK